MSTSFMISPNEIKNLVEFNRTKRFIGNASLIDLFKHQVNEIPSSIAVKYENTILTYKQLDEISDKIAHYLLSQYEGNTLKGQRIAFCVERNDQTIALILAILKVGATYIPFDPTHPDDRLQYVLNDASACLLVVDAQSLGRQSVCREICLSDAIHFQDDSRDFLAAKTVSQDEAYIMYTSGSTGQPKGVQVIQEGIIRLVINSDFIQVSSDSVFAQAGNIAFDASTLEIWAPLLNGGCVVVIPYETVIDSTALQVALKEKKVTDAWFTVALFNQLAADNPNAFGDLNNLMVGGDALNPKSIESVMTSDHPPKQIWNGYGPTENTTFTTMHPITLLDCQRTSIPIGKPISNTVCYVLDEHQQPVEGGQSGELYTSGLGLAKGYLNKPEQTLESFIPNPFYSNSNVRLETPATEIMYKTGDRVRWLDDGSIEFIGRVDNQVKIRGFRLELGEVESRLAELDLVEQAIVVTQEFHGQKQLVAYCVSRASSKEILNAFKVSVPSYMVPAYLMCLESFPLTNNGKVDKRALPMPKVSFVDASDCVPLQTKMEETVASIWENILNYPYPISRHANFFELGGHSLQVVKVKQLLQVTLDLDVKIADFFQFPILSDLCSQLETLDINTEHTALAEIKRCAPEHQLIPLSYEQQRLWVIEKTQGPSALYHIPSVFKIDGDFSPKALTSAFQNVISRHESLNTKIIEVDGQGFQQIDPKAFSLPIISVESDVVLNQLLAEDAECPFNFETGPLLRVKLYMCNGAYYLMVNMHHIITDGWSMGNFYAEIKTFYLQALGKPSDELEPLEIHYTDYCLWQRELDLTQSLTFWKQQLEDVKPLELPMIKRSEISYDAQLKKSALGLPFSNALETLAIRHQTGLFNILYSALSILLSRYCAQKDVPIASIWANRPVQALTNQIGFFANTIILRTEVDEEQSVTDFIKRNNQMVLNSFEFGSTPLDQVLSMLDIPREGTQHPLCSVAFVLQNTDGGDGKSLALPGAILSHYELKPEQAKFDLLFNVIQTEDSGLTVEVAFRKGHWSEEIQSQLLANYINILQGMVDRESTVKQLSLLNKEERQHCLIELNRTNALFDPTDLMTHFQHHVKKSPNDPAVLFKDRTLTYQQLDQLSDNIAFTLLKETNRDNLTGESIAFSLERNDVTIAVILAIVKLGAIYVPFDPSHPDERLNYVLSDSQACVLITEMAHQNRQTVCAEIHIDNIDIHQSIDPFPVSHQSPEDIAYIMYTSGSTGQPKGVRVPVRGITRLVINSPTIVVSSSSVYAQAGNIAFDASTLEIWAPLLNGASVAVIPYETVIDSEALQFELKDKKITDAWFTVALFNQLASENVNAFGGIHNLMVGGDALNPKTIAAVLNADTPPKQIWNGYGPTENTTFTTMHPIQLEDCQRGSIPIGKPIANTTCYVLDEQCQPLPIGIPGELYTSGLGLAEGYLNKPDKTEETFVLNPFYQEADVRNQTPATNMMYKTGDRVRWLSEGVLEFIGRVDNQVKIRGFRLELGEVEGLLTQLSGVDQAVVIAKEHRGQKQLFAYCVSQLAQTEILKQLRAQAPAYMIPSGMIVMESFPLTANGKVDKRKLPEANFNVVAQHEIVEPRTETEKALVHIWKELLTDVDEISADDHFFEIGGHSLLVIRMIDKINKQLGVRLEVKTVFSSPVLSDIAGILDGNDTDNDGADVKLCLDDQWLKLDKPFISTAEITIKKALLTGATGFLGAHLLHELQTNLPDAVIYCLVRGGDKAASLNKLLATCDKYLIPVDVTRIEMLCGDLNEAHLGLSDDLWGELAQQIDAIYHCGAWVNHLHSYTTLRNANVKSTLDLLSLCQQGISKQFFYVSSMSSAVVDEQGIRESLIAEAPAADNGYIQSKWVCERLITQAFEHGLCGSIYRMGNITGCTRHGASNADINHTLNLIKGCLQMGAAPDWATYDLDISPADKLAEMLILSSSQGLHNKQTINLGYLTTINWREMLEHFSTKGHRLDFVSPKEWAEKWVPAIDIDNALYSFKSFYLEPKAYSTINVEHTYVDQLNLSFDIIQLLDIYYQYWTTSGFIQSCKK